MALSPKQIEFFLELLNRVVLLLTALPEIKAAFAASNEQMKQLLQEGRDPTEAELAAIRADNQALYDQLQA